MISSQRFKRLIRFKQFKKVFLGLFLSLLSGAIIFGLSATTAFSQTPAPASALTNLCRQANPSSTPGLVAYTTPATTNPMTTADGRRDGPGANEAVYLTSSPPETSADGNYIRVWYKSIDPNYKVGWIAKRFSNGDALKLGSPSWRSSNCLR
jgi:hypothetical protein